MIAFFTLASVEPSNAALTYSLERMDGGSAILLVEGEFENGDDLTDFRALAASGEATVVVLSSPAGSVFKALEWGCPCPLELGHCDGTVGRSVRWPVSVIQTRIS